MVLTGLLALSMLLGDAGPRQEHQHAGMGATQLGKVSFTNSCSEGAQPAFTRGVALLHSFEFGEAGQAFKETLAVDPTCAIADWGYALTRWGNPFAAGIKAPSLLEPGREAIQAAERTGHPTDRERAFIRAAALLFNDFETRGQRSRVLAYRDAMATVAAAYPDDPEASAFYALWLAAAADPADKTYADQLKAGAILERLSATQPEHPGLAHYIIHAYDVPPLAPRAIDAARRYAKIAPAAPHALHMPSHTFTRVGLWQESIDTNIASAAAAKRTGNTAEELHAMDYQIYAYLQTGQDAAAKGLVDALPEVGGRFDPTAVTGAAPGSAGVFAIAAIPARYALERRDWKGAAGLDLPPHSFPQTEAIRQFAKALGAARSGDPATARVSIAALEELRNRLATAGEPYWTEQVAIQGLEASAWLDLAEGRSAAALSAMREAADREDRTEKNAVTPGPLAPARELFGEMLLELKQPAGALAELRKTIQKEPNRFNGLYLAARAASAGGDGAAALDYYQKLLRVAEHGDTPGRPELVEARRAVTAAPRTARLP